MKTFCILAVLVFAGCTYDRQEKLRDEEYRVMSDQTTNAFMSDSTGFRLCQMELDSLRAEERKYSNQK